MKYFHFFRSKKWLLLAIVALMNSIQGFSQTEGYKTGETVKTFELNTIDGTPFSLDTCNSKIIILTLWSNSCPYVKMYQKRLIHFSETHTKNSLITIGLYTNDISKSEKDNLENTKQYISDHSLPFIFLRDTKDHQVAKAFNAIKTPEFFVLAKQEDSSYKLVYKGDFDNHIMEAKATEKYIEKAITNILKQAPIVPSSTSATGCNIKWADE